MATSTLKAASSQPKTGVGSLAETNRLLAQGAASTAAPTPSGRDELPAGIAYQTYNPDGSVRSSETAAQKSAQESSDIASGKETPIGVGGEITGAQAVNPVSSAPIPPTTPTNTPVDTSQPSPSTVNATPYTGTSQPAGDASSATSAGQQALTAANASGTPAPQSAGVGMSAATTALNNATASQGYVAPPPVVQAYTDATQKLTDDYNKAMSSQGQGESLVQQYQDFTSQLGIPALNTELMNMKNIIDGTEDDIRNEVTKAGGFATDSQVLAMTNARNKTMIQNYNNLLQTRSDMQQQVQTMVGLAAQDRTYMSAQIDRQLNFDQQQVSFADKALTNAQSSIQQSIATYGAASVYRQALATGDPTAVARINATLGGGFDLKTAAATPTLDEQVKQANIAQSYAAIAASNSTVDKNNYDMNQTAVAKENTKIQAAQTASDVMDKISEATKQLNIDGMTGGNLSAGIGALTSFVPGTPAKNLADTIDTIKSNLTLTNLAQLKANSPTGASGFGALSDTEGRTLATSVASLDTGQSPDQLAAHLHDVKTHYVTYLATLGYAVAPDGTIHEITN